MPIIFIDDSDEGDDDDDGDDDYADKLSSLQTKLGLNPNGSITDQIRQCEKILDGAERRGNDLRRIQCMINEAGRLDTQLRLVVKQLFEWFEKEYDGYKPEPEDTFNQRIERILAKIELQEKYGKQINNIKKEEDINNTVKTEDNKDSANSLSSDGIHNPQNANFEGEDNDNNRGKIKEEEEEEEEEEDDDNSIAIT
jgi:hypothetical protein